MGSVASSPAACGGERLSLLCGSLSRVWVFGRPLCTRPSGLSVSRGRHSGPSPFEKLVVHSEVSPASSFLLLLLGGDG